jgi:hypothetical protein
VTAAGPGDTEVCRARVIVVARDQRPGLAQAGRATIGRGAGISIRAHGAIGRGRSLAQAVVALVARRALISIRARRAIGGQQAQAGAPQAPVSQGARILVIAQCPIRNPQAAVDDHLSGLSFRLQIGARAGKKAQGQPS